MLLRGGVCAVPFLPVPVDVCPARSGSTAGANQAGTSKTGRSQGARTAAQTGGPNGPCGENAAKA